MQRLLKVTEKKKRLAIGIMSGTSLDGVDVCLMSIEGNGTETKVDVHDFLTEQFTANEKKAILSACMVGSSNVETICHLNASLGLKFGNAAVKIIKKNGLTASEIDFISSHGQTVYHMPEEYATLQIGELANIAAVTGCITVGDFRPSDMAVKGQGAPLVPYVDHVLFTDVDENRIMVNIGGISNLTVLKKGGSLESVQAFDCGPGNMLIDGCLKRLTNGKIHYDESGKIAKSGKVNETLLNEWLKNDVFVETLPPKSTGREQYNEEFINSLIKYYVNYSLSLEDFIATVTAYTSESIVVNIKKFVEVDEKKFVIYVGGGGSYNKTILERIEKKSGYKVYTMEALGMGISSDAKEAIAFAILGNELLSGESNNLMSATGAHRNAIMGKITLPPIR